MDDTLDRLISYWEHMLRDEAAFMEGTTRLHIKHTIEYLKKIQEATNAKNS